MWTLDVFMMTKEFMIYMSGMSARDNGVGIRV